MSTSRFSDLEKDATQELLNISMGRACAGLSSIIGKEVTLSTPELLFEMPLEEALQSEPSYSAVIQSFSGALEGHAALLFPEIVVRRLLSHILQIHFQVADAPQDSLQDIELDAILEIGNIILNACIGSITNQLHCSVSSSLPKYYYGNLATIKKEAAIHETNSLATRTHLAVKELNISSYLIFVMDRQSLQSYRTLLETHLSTLGISA